MSRSKSFLSSNRNFILLWAAQILTQIGVGTINVIVGILSDEGQLSEGTKESVLGISFIILIANLPALFFAPIAGVLADRFDRRKIMFISNSSRFLLIIIFILLTGWQQLWIAYGLVFLMSVILQLFIPAEGAMIPTLVSKRYILLANSLFALTTYSSFVVGAAVGGLYLNIFGEVGSFSICGIMFFVSALLVLWINVSGITKKNKKMDITHISITKAFNGLVVSLKEVVGYISKKSILKLALMHVFLVQSFVLILVSMIFELGRQLFGVSARVAGPLIVAPAAIGLAIGFAVLNSFGKNYSRITLIILGIITGGISLLIAGLFSVFRSSLYLPELYQFVSFSFLILIGFAAPFLIIPAQTLIHENTDKNMRGRVLGIWSAVITSLATLPVLLFGFVADLIGNVSNLLICISVLAFVYVAFLCKIKSNFK